MPQPSKISNRSSSSNSELLARAPRVKAPKFCHITPILKSPHWLKISERNKYKLLSLAYKPLTTALTYLSAQPDLCSTPRGTRSSSIVTLFRPPTSSLRITNRSLRYASPHSGINFLSRSVSLGQSTLLMMSHSLIHLPPAHHSHPLSHTHYFYSRLKTHLFHKSFPP